MQLSATSHTPADERQTVLDDTKPFAGQAAPEPVQLSATSQTPADERQTVALDWKPSAGHAVPAPLQISATSQTPADERHVLPAPLNAHTDVQHDVVAPFAPP